MEIITSYFANIKKLESLGYTLFSVSTSIPKSINIVTIDYLCYSKFCLKLIYSQEYSKARKEYLRLIRANNGILKFINECTSKEIDKVALLSWYSEDTYCNRKLIRNEIKTLKNSNIFTEEYLDTSIYNLEVNKHAKV